MLVDTQSIHEFALHGVATKLAELGMCQAEVQATLAEITTMLRPKQATQPSLITRWPADIISTVIDTLVSAVPGLGSLMGTLSSGSAATSESPTISVAIGATAVAGVIAGITGSAGIVFNARQLGVYGTLGAALGLLANASLDLQISIFKGDIQAYRQLTNAIVVSGGEVVNATLSVLLAQDEQGKRFLGISLGSGIGIGSLIGLFYTIQRSGVRQLL